MNTTDKPFTRRGILSYAVNHGLYDPIGITGPAIRPAKKIFQDTCALKLDWDAPLPEQLEKRWLTWVKDLHLLEKFSLPRCYHPSTNLELHYFSDGSETAYGCIVYVRSILTDGTIHCSLILAKARLTPLNDICPCYSPSN